MKKSSVIRFALCISAMIIISVAPVSANHQGTYTPQQLTDLPPYHLSWPPFSAGNDRLFFIPDEARPRVWVSDGTLAGTEPILNGEFPLGLSEESVGALGNTVFYAGQDHKLWRYDGTVEGSGAMDTPVLDPVRFTRIGSHLFFQSDENHFQIWATDGTEQGTVYITPLPLNRINNLDLPIVNANGIAYFSISTNDHPTKQQLWKSDGTQTGTTMVAEFTLPNEIYAQDPNFTPSSSGLVFFLMISSGYQYWIWQTDGTPAGTQKVDIISGPELHDHLMVTNGPILFYFKDVLNQSMKSKIDIYQTLGVASGGVKLYAQMPIQNTYFTNTAIPKNGYVFFHYDNYTWMINGRLDAPEKISSQMMMPLLASRIFLFLSADTLHSGTELAMCPSYSICSTPVVYDINPGEESSNPSSMILVKNKVFFMAETSGKAELWVIDMGDLPAQDQQVFLPAVRHQ